MSFWEMIWSALRGIAANKLRSVLTLLGVMIGVASVILLLAVGNGSAQRVNSAIASLGTDTLVVRASGSEGRDHAGSSTKVITAQVGQQLAAAKLGHVRTVIPEVTGNVTVSSTTTSQASINVIGTTPDYFTVGTNRVDSGTAFTNADMTSAARVAVIGSTLAGELFPGGTALGQQVSVGGTPFTVVGILAQQSGVGFGDPNSVVIAPLTRIQDSFTGYGAVSSLTIQATNSGAVTAAQGESEIMLNQLLGVTDTASEPYTITDQSSLLQTAATSAASFTVLLGSSRRDQPARRRYRCDQRHARGCHRTHA